MRADSSNKRMLVSYEVFLTYQGHVSMAQSFEISAQDIGLYTNEPLIIGDPVELVIVPSQGMLNIEVLGRICSQENNPDSSQPQKFKARIEFDEESADELPFLNIKEDVRHYAASHSLSISAPAERCYELLGEFERYPEWTGVLEKGNVLERYSDGRGKVVEFIANAYIRKVTYVLEYSFNDEDYCLSWKSVGGDFVSILGRYFFKPLGSQTSSSTYELDIKFDFRMPNRIVRYFSSIVMRKSMKEFKAFVEKQC